MLDLIIKNGTVVTPWGSGSWDIGISGEKIVSVSLTGTSNDEATQVVDAIGKIS
jgi:dihydroorotase-like cyclic amidohydrolase